MKRIKNKGMSPSRAGKGGSLAAGDEMGLLQEGVRLFNLGQYAEAEALVAPAATSGRYGLLSLMGQLAMVGGRYAEALGYFDQVLPRFPDQLELRCHRAMALLKIGRKDEGKEALEAVLEIAPNSFLTLKYLGALHAEDGNPEKAEPFLRKAMALNPDEPENLYLISKLLFETDRIAEARPLLKRSIKVRPVSPIPFNLMGATYRQECRFRIALSYYRHGLRLNPKDHPSNVNYGVGLLDTGQVHAAIEHFRQYLETVSDDQVRFNLATALLQIGRLEEGWQAYEARRRMHHLRDADLPYSDWKNEPLAGKTILVLAEQGIGDELLAASMFDELIGQSGHCMIECDSRLVTLYSRSFPKATIVPRLPTSIEIPKEPPVDFTSPGMSLARWLRNDFSKFPGKVGYLIPDPQRQEFWRWRVNQTGAGLKVGIAWRSMLTKGVRRDSYSTLDEWADIFRVPGVQFINLQYGECREEVEFAEKLHGVPITTFADVDFKDDMDDVAALMSVLDLVIAPDNAVAVMAGALNVPTLQFVLAKYWSCHGKDYYPWHPSVKLFFRAWDRDWSEPLQAISIDLRRLSEQKAAEATTNVVEDESERRIVRDRIGRSALFLQSGKTDKARAMLMEILSVRPDHADANLLFGMAERALGRKQEALEAIDRAVGLDRLNAEAHNHLGAVKLDMRRPQEAIPDFEQALALRPGFPDALNNLGNAFAISGRLSEAAECYRRAIAGLSGFMTARYNYAIVLEDMGRIDEAIVEYETVTDADPRHAEAWNNLGRLYGLLHRNDEAIGAYRCALEIKPDLGEVRKNLAKKLLEVGDRVDEAIEHFEAAASTLPDDARLQNSLGAAYGLKGDLGSAIDKFERAIELMPDYADAYRNLGVALQKLGRLEQAREVLTRAVALLSGAHEDDRAG